MFRLINKSVFLPPKCQSRSLWEWVNMMFNSPDQTRIEKVGPDKACAEWLLRNGGAVRWAGESSLSKDYNSLEAGSAAKVIVEIDASGSSISHYGFGHLVGCKKIARIILHDCGYIDDRAIPGLSYIDSSLAYLQITNCRNITDNGLKQIPHLKNLKNLVIANLDAVKNISECKLHLETILPACKIETSLETK